jgi:hypothetical protein
MKLYKHLKEKEYLDNWLKGNFVFTKLSAFLKKEKEEDHFTDHQEASIIIPKTNEIICVDGFTTPISDYISEFRKAIPENEAKFILISSFSTETNEKLREKFGQYVLEFDFNVNLQKLFREANISFDEVRYNNNHKTLFSDSKIAPIFSIINNSYKNLLLKNKNLSKSVIFNKRPEYSYQKEYRFVIQDLNKKSMEELDPAMFEHFSDDKDHYFSTAIQNNEIQSLKPFFKKAIS